MSQSPGPQRLPPRPTLRPRRVQGGVRLAPQPRAGEPAGPGAWAVQRWNRVAEDAAPGDQLAEGHEYARLGQTRSLQVTPGAVRARVQGRMPQAYEVSLRLGTLTPTQWERVFEQMALQARHAASLLAGELPPSIEDVFAPLGLHLFPRSDAEIETGCTCNVESRWCKHVCCVMLLVGERLGREPFLIFELRGKPEGEVRAALRDLRSAAATERRAIGPASVYLPHIAGVSDDRPPPIEEQLADFWSAGPELRELDLPIARPDVRHPLLRRLGPSPFKNGSFPLVGLLATCFEVISDAAVRQDAPPPPAPEEPEGDDHPDADRD